MKRCPTCGVIKNDEDFHQERRKKDGMHWQCKKCHLRGRREYYNVIGRSKYLNKKTRRARIEKYTLEDVGDWT